jgi:hypothetical protein
VRLRANRKPVKIPQGGNPIGYDFVLRGGRVTATPIPSGERPCA